MATQRCCFLLILLAACNGTDGQQSPDPATQTGQVTQSERVVRRLSRFEYDNTISDLFHIDSHYGENFPVDDVVNNFDNNAAALRVGPLLADKLQQAAEDIATAVTANLAQLLPCNQQEGDTCAAQFIRTFGGKALRRPLSDAEAARYLSLHTAVAGTDGFGEGIKAVISAMLQSPYFLYRTELGVPKDGAYTLGPYEVAAELSYLFLGSMPDDALFAAAQAGELSTPAQIATQARRLLKSPGSSKQLAHFLSAWLLLGQLASTPKDDKTFPGFTADVRAALLAETTTFFDQTVHQGSGKFPDLLLPATGAGLLTQRSILATQGTSTSSSPVRRGKLVRERFLCQVLPPPPPGLKLQLPAVDPNLPNRERFSQHSTDPSCSSCHHLMDPIGFGFEHYDGIGLYLDLDAGRPIDATGEIFSAGQTSGKFDGVGELSALLVKSSDVHACFALQWFRFAYGADLELDDPVQQVANTFEKSDLLIEELLVALTQSRRFTVRAADPDVQQQTPPPATTPDMAPSPPPPPTGSFDAQVHRDSDWDTGYCSTVTVSNTGKDAGDWTVILTIQGTINNLWNALSMPAGAKIAFAGVDYNKHLGPGASTTFGFCAKK